jgi:hypothetical protein
MSRRGNLLMTLRSSSSGIAEPAMSPNLRIQGVTTEFISLFMAHEIEFERTLKKSVWSGRNSGVKVDQ